MQKNVNVKICVELPQLKSCLYSFSYVPLNTNVSPASAKSNRVPTVLSGGHYSAGAGYTLGRISVNDLGVSEFFLASADRCFAALMTCLCVKGQHSAESFAKEMKHWSLGRAPVSLPLSWYITKWLVNKFIFNIHLHEQSSYVHLLYCSGQERHSHTLWMRIILRPERFRENDLTPSGYFIFSMYGWGWQHSTVKGVDRYSSLVRGSSESIGWHERASIVCLHCLTRQVQLKSPCQNVMIQSHFRHKHRCQLM